MAATYLEVAKSIPGLTHLYALDETNQAKDLVGSAHGQNNGVVFKDGRGVFDGDCWIKIPSSKDFSASGTGELSVVAFMKVNDWTKKSANGEYVHWMGKGAPNKHEWTCRYYIDGGGGEAAARKRRTSFYAFNPAGGLGAGSYVQDEAASTTERMMMGAISTKGSGTYPGSSYQFQNAVQKDKDALSGYNIIPKLTDAPVGIGSRGDNTGFLVGTIRRVAFYNRLLTTDEQKKLWDARNLPVTGSGGVTASAAPSTSTDSDSAAESVAVNLRRRADDVRNQTNLAGLAADLDSYANQLDPR